MIEYNHIRYEKYVSWSYASMDFNYIGTLIEDWLKKMFEIINITLFYFIGAK